MDPFRHLLKKDSEYAWNDSLQSSFDSAKSEIVSLVEKGVQSFTLGAWTCLITDWSRTGVGYVLWQKRCSCVEIRPGCCTNGWAMILCGSRFCTPAESRYHPIEGELLAVAWLWSGQATTHSVVIVFLCSSLMTTIDGVVLYRGRVVVPGPLHQQGLQSVSYTHLTLPTICSV